MTSGKGWKSGVLVGAVFVLVSAQGGAVARAATPTALANSVLSLPQRKPCDVNLFNSNFSNGRRGAYPQGRPMKPAAGSVPSESRVRAQLATFMPADARRTAALQLFDRAAVKAKIASPSLRAAYAALVGTVGESTLPVFLSPRFTSMTFGSLSPGVFGGIAESIATSTGARAIVIDKRYEREHFGLFTNVIAHEILHDDPRNSGAEEATSTAVQALVHLQVLSRHPGLAGLGTELARRINTTVLAWTNSRVPGSASSAIVAPSGRGVFPGGAFTAPDVWTLLSGRGTSPEPAALRGILGRIIGRGARLPQSLPFSLATAKLFGQLNDTWLSPVERVRISVLLGLVSLDEIVKATKLTRPQAVQTFRLGSIKVACT